MEILSEFLSRTINQPVESIQEKLYKKQEDGTFSKDLVDNALDVILELDKERVSKLKQIDNSDITKFKNMGKAEALTNFEKQIKELYKVEDDLKGIDLIQSIIQKSSNTKLTEDQIKLNPLFIALEKKLNDELNNTKTTYEKQIEDLKNEYTSKEVFSKVNETALSTLEALKPILSSDPTKSSYQKRLFINDLKGEYDFKSIDGQIIPTTKDGKRAEDEHGNPLTIEKLVQRKAAMIFEFEKQGEKGSASNSGGSDPSLVVPKTKEELNKAIFNEPDPAKRIALQEAFSKLNN